MTAKAVTPGSDLLTDSLHTPGVPAAVCAALQSVPTPLVRRAQRAPSVTRQISTSEKYRRLCEREATGTDSVSELLLALRAVPFTSGPGIRRVDST